MCATGSCTSYGKSWSCPPACGSIEHYAELFSHYRFGFVFQTVGRMEDEYDFEGIAATDALHKQRFQSLSDKVADRVTRHDDILLLGAGTCKLCETCSYPDKPCRFPHRMHPSMEAAGLLVSAVCTLAGLPYYHGKNTISFISCLLAKRP
jgi:predicted metal-binding protein